MINEPTFVGSKYFLKVPYKLFSAVNSFSKIQFVVNFSYNIGIVHVKKLSRLPKKDTTIWNMDNSGKQIQR